MVRRLLVSCVVLWSATLAAQGQSARPSVDPQTRTKNLAEYAELLRSDVRAEKVAIITEVMGFTEAENAAFWPIYRDYDAELTKINDLRIANIKEYASSYNQLTDAKADELVVNAMAYQKLRTELLAKYYERIKKEMGAITAARFVQVEYQLLLIIDLQIDSALPIVGS